MFRELLEFLKLLVKKQWTGKITLDFHKGGLKKIKKEEEIKI
jgi:hypothetical protein